MNKPATQSSKEFQYGMPNDAFYGNDGKTSTRSVTKSETISWWQVDMQQLVQIERIELHLWPYALRKGYYGEVYVKTRAQESDKWSLCVNIGIPKTLSNTMRCNSTTIARFVRLFNENGDGFSVAEAKVYEIPTTTGIFEILKKKGMKKDRIFPFLLFKFYKHYPFLFLLFF